MINSGTKALVRPRYKYTKGVDLFKVSLGDIIQVGMMDRVYLHSKPG